MRIISGKFRGLQLRIPGGLPVRPTTDFAKTGLFNILNNRYDLEECSVLDLYAGTGNLSFEFVSRGVQHCVAVDVNHKCTNFIKESIAKFEIQSTLQVIQSDAIKFVERCTSRFDIIVADPPYSITPAKDLVEMILNKGLLKDAGVFILEHSSDMQFSDLPGFMEFRKYGQVGFSFFGN